jgi:hypothetical protein
LCSSCLLGVALHTLLNILGACHNSIFIAQTPILPVPNVWFWNRFGPGLGRCCLWKSRNYFLPKLVPNPFFGYYSLRFWQIQSKINGLWGRGLPPRGGPVCAMADIGGKINGFGYLEQKLD